MKPRNDIRNVAIIAHVDHGKTTLVDGMLRQTNVFHSNQQVTERVLDSNDLERERGITILAKNTGIEFEGTTINVVDTPGHADFGGEVERVLNMVDGVLLLVDAVEGPMPQTRFVLRKSLEKGHKAIVVVNKVDRPSARPDWVINETFDLFVELGATEEQADFPVVYAVALEGKAGTDPDELQSDLRPLFNTIIEHVPPPEIDADGPTQMLVTTLEHSSYVGKIAVGRLRSGTIKSGQTLTHILADGTHRAAKAGTVYNFRDLKRIEVDEVGAGDIVAIAGIEQVNIGDTLADPNDPRQLPPITVEEPTVRMTFGVNDSPFAGRDGKYLTTRQIRARLFQELERNVSLRVDDTDSPSEFIVSGRGELHIAVLIETMRREGYEFSVSSPEVIFRDGPGGKLEPVEQVFLEVPEEHWGAASEMMGRRKGQMKDLRYGDDGTVYAEYLVPTRGLLGFRQPFLTTTRGTGIFNTIFHDYEPHYGPIETQEHGSLVAQETGTVMAYALQHLTQRGTFFVKPGDEVYGGQVVGQNIRNEELVLNTNKSKVLTKTRSGPGAMVEALTAPRVMSLDESIEYLGKDELLEVTPTSLRIRKKELTHTTRQRAAKRTEN